MESTHAESPRNRRPSARFWTLLLTGIPSGLFVGGLLFTTLVSFHTPSITSGDQVLVSGRQSTAGEELLEALSFDDAWVSGMFLHNLFLGAFAVLGVSALLLAVARKLTRSDVKYVGVATAAMLLLSGMAFGAAQLNLASWRRAERVHDPFNVFAPSAEFRREGLHSIVRVGTLEFMFAFQPAVTKGLVGIGHLPSGTSSSSNGTRISRQGSTIDIKLGENHLRVEAEKGLVSVNGQQFSIEEEHRGRMFFICRDGRVFRDDRPNLPELDWQSFTLDRMRLYEPYLVEGRLSDEEERKLYVRILSELSQSPSWWMSHSPNTEPLVRMLQQAANPEELLAVAQEFERPPQVLIQAAGERLQ